MSPFIHILLSIIAAMAMDLRFKHKAIVILMLGISGVLPDLDHLINYATADGVQVPVFHNLYLLVFLPMCLLFASFIVENVRGGHSTTFQRLFLALLVTLSGHLVLDIIAGNTMMLHFPFDTSTFFIEENVLIESGIYGNIVGTGEAIFCFWLLAIVAVNLGQRRLYSISEEIRLEEVGTGGRFDGYLISKA